MSGFEDLLMCLGGNVLMREWLFGDCIELKLRDFEVQKTKRGG